MEGSVLMIEIEVGAAGGEQGSPGAAAQDALAAARPPLGD